jgi:hypothetical protein
MPALRCFERCYDREPFVCGNPASWMRANSNVFENAFFCTEHRGADDEPIPGTFFARRVSVAADVLFAATSSKPESAQREALGRLERAVERAGGVINLHAVTSLVGRYTGQAPALPAGRGRVRA